MRIDQFKEGKEKLKAGWPEDKIIEDTKTKIIVQCKNGDYLIYRFIMPSGIPEIDAVIANKIMFQCTDDLKKPSYRNITNEILGRNKTIDKRTEEIIRELSCRIQIGNIYHLRWKE